MSGKSRCKKSRVTNPRVFVGSLKHGAVSWWRDLGLVCLAEISQDGEDSPERIFLVKVLGYLWDWCFEKKCIQEAFSLIFA